jgi:hypothetical protein
VFYLKNRLYHKALRQTPYEGLAGGKFPLTHLRTFSALVMVHTPGKRPTKANRHTSHGVLLGYSVTTKYACYFNQTTNHKKLSTYHIIDEAHYGKTHHPTGHQILVDMGYEQKPLLPAIITLLSLSQYLLRFLHKPVTQF